MDNNGYTIQLFLIDGLKEQFTVDHKTSLKMYNSLILKDKWNTECHRFFKDVIQEKLKNLEIQNELIHYSESLTDGKACPFECWPVLPSGYRYNINMCGAGFFQKARALVDR